MKKTLVLLTILGMLTSCGSVDVATDYDREVDFDQYKTYAFYKPGIDQAKISDLDKKRILKAIELELSKKGLIKSENPDLLVSIFTETKERLNIYTNNFGWGPNYWGGGAVPNPSSDIEGTLFIDFIDHNRKQLVWQGLGKDILSQNSERKFEKINEIVYEIIEEYPPVEEKSKKSKK